MKKDVVKTCLLVGVLLALMLIVFFIVGNLKYSVENFARNSLIENDPTVQILFNRFDGKTILRKASVDSRKLTSKEQIEYILENLSDDDYETKTIKPQKDVCNITENIKFNSINGKCNVMIVKNDKFLEYQKKYFENESVLDYSDVSYQGNTCKNDGSKYYCILGNRENYVFGYSLFDSAYSEKDKVIIREYFLQIDVSDEKKCNKYFDSSYCENYLEMGKIDIDADVIKNDGILYEHVFKENDSNYYLEKSFIVAER